MAEPESTTLGDEFDNHPSSPEILPIKRRGRPPGSKNSSSGKAVNSSSSSKASSDANSLESAKFIGLGFVTLIELAESFVHGSAAKKIEKKRPEKIDEFKELAAKMGLQEKDKEMMSDCMAKIAERHDWMTKFAPEVLLCVSLGQYGLRQAALMRFVNNVTATKNDLPHEIKNGDAPVTAVS